MKTNRCYRPSNGTEGVMFQDKYCANCIHGKFELTGNEKDKPCNILTMVMMYDLKDDEYPKEWVYDKDGIPTCTAYKEHIWTKDEFGEYIDPILDDPIDPNKLLIEFPQ